MSAPTLAVVIVDGALMKFLPMGRVAFMASFCRSRPDSGVALTPHLPQARCSLGICSSLRSSGVSARTCADIVV